MWSWFMMPNGRQSCWADERCALTGPGARAKAQHPEPLKGQGWSPAGMRPSVCWRGWPEGWYTQSREEAKMWEEEPTCSRE